jgi:hypothetical protein
VGTYASLAQRMCSLSSVKPAQLGCRLAWPRGVGVLQEAGVFGRGAGISSRGGCFPRLGGLSLCD